MSSRNQSNLTKHKRPREETKIIKEESKPQNKLEKLIMDSEKRLSSSIKEVKHAASQEIRISKNEPKSTEALSELKNAKVRMDEQGRVIDEKGNIIHFKVSINCNYSLANQSIFLENQYK
jgi:hypothetical protein